MCFLPTKDVIEEVQKIEGPLWKVPRCYCVGFLLIWQAFALDLIFEQYFLL